MLNVDYQYLLSPLNIRGTIFPNRVFKNTDSRTESDISGRIADRCGFPYRKDHIDQISEQEIRIPPWVSCMAAISGWQAGSGKM